MTIDKKPLSGAERQSKRQEKFKQQAIKLEVLEHDVRAASGIINDAIASLKTIIGKSDMPTERVLLPVVGKLESASNLLNKNQN